MKTASPALTALINGSKEFFYADLLTIVTSAATLRYTSADFDIVFDGNTFSPYPFERGSTRTVIGTEVDTLDVTIFANDASLILGIPAPQFASNGGFDGATIKLERAYLSDWGVAPVGALLNFQGRISNVTPSRTQVEVSARSDKELLNIMMPRNSYQAGCLHQLYDAGCGLSKAAYQTNSAVTSGSSRTSINCALGTASGFFDLGTITFTSGANAGATRTVKSYVVGNVKLSLPLPYAPGVGDTFSLYAGCDKTQAACSSKFNNVVNFRGFPYIPVPETAL